MTTPLPTLIADALTNYRRPLCRHSGEQTPGATERVRCTRPGILTDSCPVQSQWQRPCCESEVER